MTNLPPLNSQVLELIKKRQEEDKKARQAMNKLAEEFIKQQDEEFKRIFSGMIKQNFLIEMKERILKRADMTEILIEHYDAFDLSQKALILGKDNLEFDICKFITMYHFFNTIIVDNNKRASMQNDKDYINDLSNQVVEAIKIRKVALMFNSKNSLEAYYPLTYSLFALNNYLLIEFDKAIAQKRYPNEKNAIFKSQMQLKMLSKVKASLILVDNNLVEEAFNPLRSLYELYMIYLTLDGCNSESIERYCKYVEYQFDYQRNGNIPKEVEEQCKSLNKSEAKISKTDYLNFGWLDSILEYNYIDKKERKYKLVDVAKFLDFKNKNKIGSVLYKGFRDCSPLSHGFNGFLKYYSTKQSLCERISYILNLLANELSKAYKIDLNLNGINLLNYLTNYYNRQIEYDKFINNNPKLNESLNNYYVNRIK